MSEAVRPKLVRQEGGRGEFVVIVPNAEFPHLSPHKGKLTEQEVRNLLAEEYGMSRSEIESLIEGAPLIPLPAVRR
jgi:hypothetical protein